MNQTIRIPHIPYRFLTTMLVFVIMVVGFFIATKLNELKDINFSAVNTSLLLANSVVLLMIFGVLLRLREDLANFFQKRKG